MYYTFAGFGAVAGLLLLLVFAILQWLHVSAGSFIDCAFRRAEYVA